MKGVIDVWDKTVVAKSRLRNKPGVVVGTVNGEEIWYFRGRRMIGRDTPINNGVYVGEAVREAIVVNDGEQPGLRRAYEQFLRVHGDNSRIHILTEVCQFVREIMPPDYGILERLEEWENGKEDDVELRLDSLIGVGGVCRHLSLMVAYIIERLIKSGELQGKVSIDRNSILGAGGHAWVRYRTSAGRIAIIDPVIIEGGFKEYLDVIKATGKAPWHYFRPDDDQ